MTKKDMIEWSQKLWTEAHAYDPEWAIGAAKIALGRDVWVWDNLTIPELQRLSSKLFPVAIAARA